MYFTMTGGRSAAKRAATQRGVTKQLGERPKVLPTQSAPPKQTRAKNLTPNSDSLVRAERGRQVIRHLEILTALGAAPQGLTAQDLLDVTGGSRTLRTVYRDLEQLTEIGFAVSNEDQRWRLSEVGPRLRLPLHSSELLALLLAEQLLTPILVTSVGAPFCRLREKLLSMVAPNVRRYCEDLSATAVATHKAPVTLHGQEDVVGLLQEAIVKEQVLRLQYVAPGKELEVRDVEPYATWYADGRLYLVARCRRANELRTFAVPRVRDATVLDDTFDVDPGFNLEEYVQRGFGVHHGPIHHVVLEFDHEVAHVARERVFHKSQRIVEGADGFVRLALDVAGLPEIAAFVASFGGHVRAIEPAELVARVRELHARGLSVHSR